MIENVQLKISDTPTAQCPKCGHNTNTPHGHRDYFCFGCKMAFASEDDGTIGYGNPERFAARKEEYMARQQRRGQYAGKGTGR